MPSEYWLKFSQWILKWENVVCSLPWCLPGNAIPNISVAKVSDNLIYDSSAVSVSKLINQIILFNFFNQAFYSIKSQYHQIKLSTL